MRQMKPWNESGHPIRRLKSEMDNLFSRVFEDLPTPSFLSQSDTFTPKCNIEERRNDYVVEVEIPGVDPQDVQIELTGNTLTIKGERRREVETEDEDNKLHVVEQSYGSFYRSFALPDNVNVDDIRAENRNGMLMITLPKDKKEKPRRIIVE